MKRKSLKKTIMLFLVFFALLCVSTFIGLLQVYKALSKLDHDHVSRYESYKLANELKVDSDELTRFVRTYAATG